MGHPAGDLENATFYVAEPLDGGRVQIFREVWLDGRLADRHTFGSPVPMALALDAVPRLLL